MSSLRKSFSETLKWTTRDGKLGWELLTSLAVTLPARIKSFRKRADIFLDFSQLDQFGLICKRHDFIFESIIRSLAIKDPESKA